MTQIEQTPGLVNRQVTGDRDSSVALVQAQMKIARGVATLGLIAGVAIGLGVPLIVLTLHQVRNACAGWLSAPQSLSAQGSSLRR